MVSGATDEILSHCSDTSDKEQGARGAAHPVGSVPLPQPGSTFDPLSAEIRVLELIARLQETEEENEAMKRVAAAAAAAVVPGGEKNRTISTGWRSVSEEEWSNGVLSRLACHPSSSV